MTAPAPRRDPGWLRRYWPLYLVIVVLGFAVPETIAIISSGDGGTLSELTRDWIGTSQGQASGGWIAMTVIGALFGAWWIGHTRRLWPWEKRDREVQEED